MLVLEIMKEIRSEVDKTLQAIFIKDRNKERE
jgi:hypothetical protein